MLLKSTAKFSARNVFKGWLRTCGEKKPAGTQQNACHDQVFDSHMNKIIYSTMAIEGNMNDIARRFWKVANNQGIHLTAR